MKHPVRSIIETETSDNETASNDGAKRKQYSAPSLKVYGRLSEITEAAGGSNDDYGGGFQG